MTRPNDTTPATPLTARPLANLQATWRLTPGADLQWRRWGDEPLVYHPPAGALHILNPLAALLLERLASGAAPGQGLLSQAGDRFELQGDDDLPAMVDHCLAELSREGLIERAWPDAVQGGALDEGLMDPSPMRQALVATSPQGGVSPVLPSQVDPAGPTVGQLSADELAERLLGPGIVLRMGPFLFRISTTLAGLVEPVRLLYAHYPLQPTDRFVDGHVHVAPRSLAERLRGRASLIVDDDPVFDPFPVAQAVPMLEWGVNWCVFTRPHQCLALHAAVLERHGRGVILPGMPGAGKSTFCAGLSLRGWRLLSDEACVMRPPAIQLIPVPRPISLKEGSIEVIRRFEPSAVFGPATPGTRKGTVAHLQVAADAVRRGGEWVEPALIVFPTHRAGGGVHLEPSPKAGTLMDLAQDAFNFSILGKLGFDTLAELVDRCDCHMLTYDDMGQAIDRLDALMREVTR